MQLSVLSESIDRFRRVIEESLQWRR